MKHFAALAVAVALIASTPAFAASPATVTGQSGNVANASAAAVLTGQAGKTTYLREVVIKAMGATAAACVAVAITGADVGTINWDYCVGAGATTPQPADEIAFPDFLIYASNGGSITVTLPPLGAGNTNASMTALGYVK